MGWVQSFWMLVITSFNGILQFLTLLIIVLIKSLKSADHSHQKAHNSRQIPFLNLIGIEPIVIFPKHVSVVLCSFQNRSLNIFWQAVC